MTQALALPAATVLGLVAEQGLENPALSVSFDLDQGGHGGWRPTLLAAFAPTDHAGPPSSLHEHVAAQIPLLVRDPALRPIAQAWLESLEPTGWVGSSVREISYETGASADVAEKVLLLLQEAEPDGLFARSLKECLAIQMRARDELSPQMASLLENLPLLASGELRLLAGRTGIAPADLPAAIARLRKLNPKPGTQIDAAPAPLPAPDFLITMTATGGFDIQRGSWLRPTVALTSQPGKDMAGRVRTAKVFAAMLDSRDRLIFQAVTAVLDHHAAFLAGTLPYPLPLGLSDIARRIGVHDTTIGRIRNHVVISDGAHAVRLRDLFAAPAALRLGSPISAKEVLAGLNEAMQCRNYLETPTDLTIQRHLSGQGIEISRRTIAKYRALIRATAPENEGATLGRSRDV